MCIRDRVNNAGIIKRCDAVDVTEADWDTVIDINEKVVFFLSQAFAKQYIKQGHGGKIININSMLSYQGGIRVPSYTASKSAGMGLTKAMCNEWASHNINVNAIAPGVYDTEMTHDALDAPGSLVLKNRVALKRFGREGEMNGALIYFASDACTYTTGQLLVIDGGMTSML